MTIKEALARERWCFFVVVNNLQASTYRGAAA